MAGAAGPARETLITARRAHTVKSRLATPAPGVMRIRFHHMRHTSATLLLEAGETEKTVAVRLGDAVEMVNETYAHVTGKMRRRSAATLAGILDGESRAQDVPSRGAP